MELLICTGNQYKAEEIAGFLCSVKTPKSFKDYPDVDSPEETSLSFHGNALIKATFGFKLSGLISVADDSGLEVFSLNGEPGIYSSRYFGPNATDSENNEKLLRNLQGLRDRRARFVTAMALVSQKNIVVVTGSVEGIILEKPKGSGGFGYDPLFYIPELGKTMAELSLKEKNRISHRGRAMEKLVERMGLLFDFSKHRG